MTVKHNVYELSGKWLKYVMQMGKCVQTQKILRLWKPKGKSVHGGRCINIPYHHQELCLKHEVRLGRRGRRDRQDWTSFHEFFSFSLYQHKWKKNGTNLRPMKDYGNSNVNIRSNTSDNKIKEVDAFCKKCWSLKCLCGCAQFCSNV